MSLSLRVYAMLTFPGTPMLHFFAVKTIMFIPVEIFFLVPFQSVMHVSVKTIMIATVEIMSLPPGVF